MKKYFLKVFFSFLFFSTDMHAQDAVSDYLANNAERIISQTPFLLLGLYHAQKRIMGKNNNKYTARPKTKPSFRQGPLNRELIEKIVRERGFKGKYTLVLMDKEDLYNGEKKQELSDEAFVIQGSHSDDPVVLSIKSTESLHILHHEIGHMLQSKRRNLFWYYPGLPALAIIGINNFLDNQLPDLVWPRLGLLTLIGLYKIMRIRTIEGEADDLIPNKDSLLKEYKKEYHRILENVKEGYQSSTNKTSINKKIGKTFLRTVFPKSLAFPVWEALFLDIEHPSRQYSIDRLEKRITGTLDTTPKPANPPLLSNNTFRVAETTGILYGLAAHALYTFSGPDKMLDLMTPLSEKLISSLASKAVDALQNKVSKKISSVFNKQA